MICLIPYLTTYFNYFLMVSKCQVRIRVYICIRHLLASIQISSKDLRLDPAPDPDSLFKFFCLLFFKVHLHQSSR